MSDSVQLHRRQPTRLPHPWDSPGKNTGMGCHFLLQCVKVKSLSHVRLLANPWTTAHQGPPSLGFSRQEYWNGLPFLPPGDIPDPGIEPGSPALQSDTLLSESPGKPHAAAAAAAKSLQLCPTLCDPIDGSPPGSPVPGILQARTLEWVAISFSNV